MKPKWDTLLTRVQFEIALLTSRWFASVPQPVIRRMRSIPDGPTNNKHALRHSSLQQAPMPRQRLRSILRVL